MSPVEGEERASPHPVLNDSRWLQCDQGERPQRKQVDGPARRHQNKVKVWPRHRVLRHDHQERPTCLVKVAGQCFQQPSAQPAHDRSPCRFVIISEQLRLNAGKCDTAYEAKKCTRVGSVHFFVKCVSKLLTSVLGSSPAPRCSLPYS